MSAVIMADVDVVTDVGYYILSPMSADVANVDYHCRCRLFSLMSAVVADVGCCR
jgi:hypothetical protein